MSSEDIEIVSDNKEENSVEVKPTPIDVVETSVNNVENSINVVNDNNITVNNIQDYNSNMMPETRDVEPPVGTKKKSHKKIVVFLVLLLLIIGGLAFYILYFFNAKSFAKMNINKLIKSVNNVNVNDFDVDFLKDDIKSNLSFNVDSTSKDLEFLDNFSLKANYNLNLSKRYADAAFVLKQDAGELNSSIVIDDYDVLARFNEIYPFPITTKYEEDFFENIMPSDASSYVYKSSDYKYIVSKVAEYFREALLSNGDIKTTRSISNATYSYKLNDSFLTKYNELLNKDEKLVSLYDGEIKIEENPFDELSVTIGYFSRKIENINIKSGDYNFVVNKLNKNNYKITIESDDDSNKEVFNLVMDSNTATITKENDDNKGKLIIRYNKDDIGASFEYDDYSFNIDIKNYKSSEKNIVGSYKSEVGSINFDGKLSVHDKQIKADFSVSFVNKNNDEINFNVKSDMEFGTNLITKKPIIGGVDINSISESDAQSISTKFEEELSKFKLFDEIVKRFKEALIRSIETNYNRIYINDEYAQF